MFPPKKAKTEKPPKKKKRKKNYLIPQLNTNRETMFKNFFITDMNDYLMLQDKIVHYNI